MIAQTDGTVGTQQLEPASMCNTHQVCQQVMYYMLKPMLALLALADDERVKELVSYAKLYRPLAQKRPRLVWTASSIPLDNQMVPTQAVRIKYSSLL